MPNIIPRPCQFDKSIFVLKVVVVFFFFQFYSNLIERYISKQLRPCVWVCTDCLSHKKDTRLFKCRLKVYNKGTFVFLQEIGVALQSKCQHIPRAGMHNIISSVVLCVEVTSGIVLDSIFVMCFR